MNHLQRLTGDTIWQYLGLIFRHPNLLTHPQIVVFEAIKPKFYFNFFAVKNGFFNKALFNASRLFFDITHFELFVFGRSASLLVVCHFLTNLLTPLSEILILYVLKASLVTTKFFFIQNVRERS